MELPDLGPLQGENAQTRVFKQTCRSPGQPMAPGNTLGSLGGPGLQGSGTRILFVTLALGAAVHICCLCGSGAEGGMGEESSQPVAELRTPPYPKGRAILWMAVLQRLFQRSQALGGPHPSSHGCHHQCILHL